MKLASALSCAAIMALSSSAFASKVPPTMKTEGDKVIINDIIITKSTGEIRIATSLALTRGILEYLLVNDEGKTYESALQLPVQTKASEINFALILVGGEPVPYRQLLEYQEKKDGLDLLKKEHPKALFTIDLVHKGRKVFFSEFLNDRENKHNNLTWVHTGGYFHESGKYMADIDHCLIGIWPDASSPLNLFNQGHNPYGADDLGFEMGTPKNVTLTKGMAIEIVIRRKK